MRSHRCPPNASVPRTTHPPGQELSLAEGGSYSLRPAVADVFLPRLLCETPFGPVGQNAWRVLRARFAHHSVEPLHWWG